MTENNPSYEEMIKEHEVDLKIAVEQAYSAIGKHSFMIDPKINYESLEDALRVAIDQIEEICAIKEAKLLQEAIA